MKQKLLIIILLCASFTTYAQDSVLSSLADKLANKCDVAQRNYQDAIVWYEDVIGNPETSYCDSIFAVIDLGDLYLEMEENGLKAENNTSQYIPKSARAHSDNCDTMLQLIPQRKSHSCTLDPVTALTAETAGEDLFLTWDYPASVMPPRVSLSYYETLIENTASTYGRVWTDIANRFDTQDLSDYAGWRVNAIYIYKFSQNIPNDYYVRIWKNQPGYALDSAVLIYEQKVQDAKPGWVKVPIMADIRINNDLEYMFGEHQDGLEHFGIYQWPTDAGPATPGKGDIVYYFNPDDPSQTGWHTHNVDYCLETELENPAGITECLRGYNVRVADTIVQTIGDPYTRHYIGTFDDNDSYCVTAIYDQGESEPACATIDVTTIDEQEGHTSAFEVYPNPSHDIININFTPDKPFNYTLLNAQGQVILKRIGTIGSERLRLGHLPKGIYFLQLNSEEKTETMKVVIK